MYAFELLAKLKHLTLCGQDEDGELEFVGTFKQWQDAAADERRIADGDDDYWDRLRDERCWI